MAGFLGNALGALEDEARLLGSGLKDAVSKGVQQGVAAAERRATQVVQDTATRIVKQGVQKASPGAVAVVVTRQQQLWIAGAIGAALLVWLIVKAS